MASSGFKTLKVVKPVSCAETGIGNRANVAATVQILEYRFVMTPTFGTDLIVFRD